MITPQPTALDLLSGITEKITEAFRAKGFETDHPAVGKIIALATTQRASEITRSVARLSRGATVVGPVGSGKTDTIRTAFHSTRVVCRSAISLIYRFNDEGSVFWTRLRSTLGEKDIYIDDLGAEPAEGGINFGSRWSMSEFIVWRYECWKRWGSLFFCSSNLPTYSAFVSRYGDRAASRLAEMTCPIVYNGPNRRLAESNWI